MTLTARPAWARATAAARPFGPAPTTTASYLVLTTAPLEAFWQAASYGRVTWAVTSLFTSRAIPSLAIWLPQTAPVLSRECLVLHQAFGLDDDIRRQTDRVASLGYLAVAPDLVADGGWRCVARLFVDVARGKGEGVERAEAVIAWLKRRSDCNGQIGAIGFCLGGGFAYLLGLSGELSVTAPNYGMAPKSLTGSCPVIASYGGKDLVFGRQGKKVERALSAAGVEHDVKVYPDAGHGFMNQIEGHQAIVALNRPLMAFGYQREASEDTWARIEEFFARYLS